MYLTCICASTDIKTYTQLTTASPPVCMSQVLVPPGYGEDVKTWPPNSILPPEPVKECPPVSSPSLTNVQNRSNVSASVEEVYMCPLLLFFHVCVYFLRFRHRSIHTRLLPETRWSGPEQPAPGGLSVRATTCCRRASTARLTPGFHQVLRFPQFSAPSTKDTLPASFFKINQLCFVMEIKNF